MRMGGHHFDANPDPDLEQHHHGKLDPDQNDADPLYGTLYHIPYLTNNDPSSLAMEDYRIIQEDVFRIEHFHKVLCR
jgi:hypothetical protein